MHTFVRAHLHTCKRHMNGKGSIRVTKTKVLQVRSEDAMDNWVSPLSGERFRKGSMEEEEEGEEEGE